MELLPVVCSPVRNSKGSLWTRLLPSLALRKTAGLNPKARKPSAAPHKKGQMLQITREGSKFVNQQGFFPRGRENNRNKITKSKRKNSLVRIMFQQS
jgi:hypothetical protein